MVRRFEGKDYETDQKHGQQAWAALRNNFYGCSREALREKRFKMQKPKTPFQDPDELLYIIDSGWDRLNVSIPPEGLQIGTFYHQSTKVLREPILKGGTSALQTFDESYR